MRIQLLTLLIILNVLLSCENIEKKDESTGSITSIKKTDSISPKDSDLPPNEVKTTELGPGIISINFDDKTVLHFYASPEDKDPKRTIEFFNDLEIKSWNIRNLEAQQEWLKPEVLWIDYSAFVFRCVTITDNWVEVIVNNETGEKLWLKKSKLTTFKDWETYLKEMFGVSRMADHPQKIRISPQDDSDEIPYQGQDCFQVKSMKGDWIEIYTAEYCDDSYTDSKTKIRSGWIKWRNGNQILIDYSTTS